MSENSEFYSIHPSRTALLIIDAQRVYSAKESPLCVSNFEETLTNINTLATACREKNMPVFVIQHVYDSNERDVGRLGDFKLQELWKEGTVYAQLDQRLTLDDSDIHLKKSRFSAFMNTSLESYLKALRVDTLIVTGFMTQYCSVTTARHAHDLDYKVIFAHDANDGPSLQDSGFGPVPIEDIKRVIHTVLSVGVAEVITTCEAMKRIPQSEHVLPKNETLLREFARS